jgi:two-component system NtrC family sensor kinase
LAVSLGIVEAHGGTLTVDSPRGGGAAFTIALPVGGVGIANAEGPQVSTAGAGQRAILIVDDEPEIRDALAEILTGAQHRVVAVSSGREALERIAVEHYDVILTDIRMPDIDGRELYQEIEIRWPGQAGRVVFITGDYAGFVAARIRQRERAPGDREAVPAGRCAPRRRRPGGEHGPGGGKLRTINGVRHR